MNSTCELPGANGRDFLAPADMVTRRNHVPDVANVLTVACSTVYKTRFPLRRVAHFINGRHVAAAAAAATRSRSE